MKSLDQSKKPAIKSLLRTARKYIRSTTSSNLRSIFVQTGVYVKLGLTIKHSLSAYKAYKVPQESLFYEIREGHWTVLFDEENQSSFFEKLCTQIWPVVCQDPHVGNGVHWSSKPPKPPYWTFKHENKIVNNIDWLVCQVTFFIHTYISSYKWQYL